MDRNIIPHGIRECFASDILINDNEEDTIHARDPCFCHSMRWCLQCQCCSSLFRLLHHDTNELSVILDLEFFITMDFTSAQVIRCPFRTIMWWISNLCFIQTACVSSLRLKTYSFSNQIAMTIEEKHCCPNVEVDSLSQGCYYYISQVFCKVYLKFVWNSLPRHVKCSFPQ